MNMVGISDRYFDVPMRDEELLNKCVIGDEVMVNHSMDWLSLIVPALGNKLLLSLILPDFYSQTKISIPLRKMPLIQQNISFDASIQLLSVESEGAGMDHCGAFMEETLVSVVLRAFACQYEGLKGPRYVNTFFPGCSSRNVGTTLCSDIIFSANLSGGVDGPTHFWTLDYL